MKQNIRIVIYLILTAGAITAIVLYAQFIL